MVQLRNRFVLLVISFHAKTLRTHIQRNSSLMCLIGSAVPHKCRKCPSGFACPDTVHALQLTASSLSLLTSFAFRAAVFAMRNSVPAGERIAYPL